MENGYILKDNLDQAEISLVFQLKNKADWEVKAFYGDLPVLCAGTDIAGICVASSNGTVLPVNRKSYDNVTGDRDEICCTSRVRAGAGSCFIIQDYYALRGGIVRVRRKITVEKAGADDKGFFAEYSFRLSNVKRPEQYQWFAPSAWYGQGDGFFEGTTTKLAYDGTEAAGPVDLLSAPVIACYDEAGKLTVELTDLTKGRRETVADDCDASKNKLLINERINLPGLGVRKTGVPAAAAALFHVFPGYTRNYSGVRPNTYIRRMLPVKEGLARECEFSIAIFADINYLSMMKRVWRRAYSRFAKTDFSVDLQSVRDILNRYVNRSYGVVNSEPQYMTKSDHFEPESGFLYRNVDLAWLMLEAYYLNGETEFKKRAYDVINAQVSHDRLFGNIVFPFDRSTAEGLHSLLRAWKLEKEHGHDNAAWLKYVVSVARYYLDKDEYYSIPLMIALYRLTGQTPYIDAAQRKGNYAWENGFSSLHFMGGIVDFTGAPCLDRESALLALEGYLDLYEATKNGRYLEMAAVCADYLETYQVIQDVDMTPAYSTGNESKMICHGNDVSSVGLSFIAATCAGGDIYSVYSVPDFYRLFKFTNDIHYLDFAGHLERNSLKFVNMGNYSGMMNDSLYQTGKGFINEYLFIGASTDKNGNGRGRGHDSNIAWCPYVILSSQQRLKEMTEEYFL